MSRQIDPRASVASKITFDALHVDSGEESEEEEVSQPTQHEETFAETKPTKSAIKRAQKQARTERRQQQKALAKAQRNKPGEMVASTSTDQSEDTGSVDHHASDDESIPAQEKEEAPAPPPKDVKPKDVKPKAPQPELNGSSIQPAAPKKPVTELPVAEKPVAAPPPAKNPPPASQPVKAPPPEPENAIASAEKAKKRQSFLTRTLWTFIMIGGFIGLLLLGHAYMVLLVLLCQTLVYREVTTLFSLKSQQVKNEDDFGQGKDPWSKTLNWYFFAVTNYFLYGESIIYYFKHVVFVDAQLVPFVTNHRMISFVLYTIGFVGFVLSLQKGYLKQQFGLFCWVHMSLLLIVVSSHFIVNNILEGLIWFWVPASLVICNDVFAYLWGITVGRTPLIKLSPKKTVEGFVGAFFSTIVFGLVWGTFFMRFNYMICPVHDLGVSAWDTIQCRPNPIFVWRDLAIWKPLAAFLSQIAGRSITTLSYTPYHYHLFFLSVFASLVAPFGGFFASGFKRAFNIKDFGHSIPGHGGMTDRMDCQFLMGVFTYVYYSSLIREHNVTVGTVLQTIASGLTLEEQLELLSDLKRYLVTQGIQNP